MPETPGSAAGGRQRPCAIAAAALILLACSAARGDPARVTRFTLRNGIRVVVLHVPDSRHFGIFSYLPLGLAADGKGRTQWSHLVEHLTLRTTGPIADYRRRNGETMPQGMHLDFLGARGEWLQGVDLQAKWLSGLPLTQQALGEEVPKALSEVKVTAARLFAHKWAVAAWNQVVRHGQRDVAVCGALRSARLGDVQAYRDRHLVPLRRAVVCAVGGVKPETLKPALDKRLGGITSAAAALPAATAKPQGPRQRSATWDLPAAHYIETYPIPKSDHKDYPALHVAAMLLRQGLFMDPAMKAKTGLALCGADLATPEQWYFFVNASLKPGADAAAVTRQVAGHIAGLARPEAAGRIAMLAAALSKQMSAPMDIGAAMRHKPAHVTEAMITGNVGLQWGLLEFQHGGDLPALAKGVSGVSAGDVAAVVKRYLSEGRRSTLKLVPKG